MKWSGSRRCPYSAARQSAELRLERRNAFTRRGLGREGVFLQDKRQNGNRHRGGRESSFSHFNCTSAVWRAGRREGRLAQNRMGASPNRSLEAPRGFITNPTAFTVKDTPDSHGSPFSPLPQLCCPSSHPRPRPQVARYRLAEAVGSDTLCSSNVLSSRSRQLFGVRKDCLFPC